MVNIYTKFKYIIFQGCILYPDKKLDLGADIGVEYWEYMWDRQELEYHWERITKKDWESEESDIRGYLVGNPILY